MTSIDSLKLSIEFVAGTWTDVSQYVDWSAGVSFRCGRNTPYDQVGPGTFGCTLDNTDGRFSTNRQVLLDNVTPNPYWPNVQLRKRVRYSWVIGGVEYPQFTGKLSGLPPFYKDGRKPRVALSAKDRLAQLAGIDLLPPLQPEILADSPIMYFPLTDAEGSRSAANSIAGAQRQLNIVGESSQPLQFASDGVGSSNGSAVQFSPSASTSGGHTDTGQYLASYNLKLTIASALTIEFWFKGTDQNNGNGQLQLFNGDRSQGFEFDGPAVNVFPGGATYDGLIASNIYSTSADGNWHHIALVINSNGSGQVFGDGVPGATVAAGTFNPALLYTQLLVGGATGNPYSGAGQFRYNGSIGQLAIYAKALSAAAIARHYEGGSNWTAETVDQRIRRMATFAGLAASDMNLDVSKVVLSSYDQAGKDVASAQQDAVSSESGGAALWTIGDGTLRFVNRDARNNAPLAATFDAEADLLVDSWQPTNDDDTLVNQIEASRATASDASASTQTASDQKSIAQLGLSSDSITSYAQSDADVLDVAQLRVAQQAWPAPRVAQVPLDLADGCTGTDPNNTGTAVLVEVAQLQIGSRVRVGNLDPTAGLGRTIDLFVEGWEDTGSDVAYSRVLDTSSAAMATGKYDDGVARYQCDGQSLHTALSATDTTIVIDTTPSTLPRFTVAASAYPLTIQIGAEHITLPAPPSGSTSPQTFTGATRGVDGTVAAAQAAGTEVDLYPITRFTL